MIIIAATEQRKNLTSLREPMSNTQPGHNEPTVTLLTWLSPRDQPSYFGQLCCHKAAHVYDFSGVLLAAGPTAD
ncbi:hypothetical protein ACLKA7_012253 [Drosophila subpalustris]